MLKRKYGESRLAALNKRRGIRASCFVNFAFMIREMEESKIKHRRDKWQTEHEAFVCQPHVMRIELRRVFYRGMFAAEVETNLK